MTDTCNPVDPDSLAEQMGDLPKAGDRLRLVGLDHAARVQNARLGATSRRLALAQARRPDDGAAIARLETQVATETQAQRSYHIAVQTAEIEAPARARGSAVIHGRVFEQGGDPAVGATVAAIDAAGRSQRFSCTDGKGYFHLSLPVTSGQANAVFLQVSGADRAVLHRDSEATALADQGVTYRVIQLGAAGRPPCPEPPERATMPDLLGQPETVAVVTLGRLGLKLGQRLTQRDPERAGLVLSQQPATGAPVDDKTSVTLVIGVAESADTVTVLDVVGMSRDEATARLKKAGLAVGAISTRPGDKPDVVLAQDPAAGIAVAPGTAVALVVAVQPPDNRVAVPELVGKTLDDAARLLKEAGLERGRIELRDDTQVGLVLAQNPQAGTPAEKGSGVDLVVGRQAEIARAQVPNLREATLGEARTALAEARLTLGEVTGPQNGRVVEQKPAAGTVVAAGTPVAIALARAPTPTAPVGTTKTAGTKAAATGATNTATAAPAKTSAPKATASTGTAATPAFAARLAKAMSAEQDFAALGIEAKALGAKLSGAAVGEAKAAQALARLGEAELQKRLELQNRKQARDFKRMLRSGLERL